jgi:hypothetical protein
MLNDAKVAGLPLPPKEQVIAFADQRFDQFIAPLITSAVPFPFNTMVLAGAKVMLNFAVGKIYDRLAAGQ